MEEAGSHKEMLPHLFRQEYARMTAVLCRHFGLKHIAIAEDIASDTFLKASENWAVNGIPANPAAWLYTVARNKTKDYFKHIAVFETQIKEAIKPNETISGEAFEFSDQIIFDSQLAMIFAVCNPLNPAGAQICLALQVLCGFGVDEIASAFLAKRETVKKRLQRARTQLRNNNFQIKNLSAADIKERLDTVLKTLYLLFNEGYFSKTGNQPTRIELCSEATRLTLLLTENPLTNTAQVNALLALMCFQSSRLEARTGVNSEALLFDKQDKDLWDKALIQRGNYYLANATNGYETSKYHLEAGIAYWHATATGDDKWQPILQLYNQLLLIEYSPVAALNRAFVFSKIYGYKKAIREVQKHHIPESNYYHGLLGYLYAHTDIDTAIKHYTKAIEFSRSRTEQQTLNKEITYLEQKKGTTLW